MTTTSRYLTILAALAFAAFLPSAASALPTDLDPGYGSNGIAILPSTLFVDTEGAFDFSPDGRAGFLGDAAQPAGQFHAIWTAAKLTPSGGLDPSFETLGLWSGEISEYPGSALGVAITNGGLAAVGDAFFPGPQSSQSRWTTLRLGSDHSAVEHIDEMANPGGDDVARAVKVLPDGRLLVAGSCGANPCIAIHNASGAANDMSFNAGAGYAPASTTTGSFFATGVQPDGRYVSVGSRGGDILVVRHPTSGVAVGSLGDGSAPAEKFTIDVAGSVDEALGLAVQPDGKLVIVGCSVQTAAVSTCRLTVTRANPDGTIDRTFGTNGSTMVPLRTGDLDGRLQSVSIQPDGKIVAAGEVSVGSATTAVVVRFTAGGAIDTSFGTNGQLRDVPGTSKSAYKTVSVLPSGKIMLGALVTLNGQSATQAVTMRLVGDPVGGGLPAKAKAKITSPSKSKLKRKKFTKLAGTASGDGVSKVEISIVKTDSKLLKKKKRCLQLSSNKAKFKKVKAVKKKCVPVKWLKATGTTKWSYKFKKSLPAGKYTIYVRATGAAGVQTTPTKKSLKLTK